MILSACVIGCKRLVSSHCPRDANKHHNIYMVYIRRTTFCDHVHIHPFNSLFEDHSDFEDLLLLRQRSSLAHRTQRHLSGSTRTPVSDFTTMESMMSTAQDAPFNPFWSLFTQPAAFSILYRISRAHLTDSTRPDVVLDILFGITIAYINERDARPGYSETIGETMAHMGLSPLFQAEIINSQRFWRAPLVEKVECMLRWKVTGIRTLLHLASQPGRMTASLATKKIEAQDDDEPICGICREKKAVGDVVKILRCGHWFDDDCLDSWLCVHNSCPACRATAVDIERQLAIPW